MPRPKNLVYSVQEHHATHKHFDLRLEWKGVLWSWAVPRGPPKTAGDKRLAIRTPNHPKSYAFFDGVIKEGSYGAGRVILWDKGVHDPQKFNSREIITSISGKRLKGTYVLIRTKFGKQDNWLFFKKKPALRPVRA
jgi:DNA ligase D-like protein (predicted 3'-phosphoesterase)